MNTETNTTTATATVPLTVTIIPDAPVNGRQLVNKNTGKVTGHEYFLGSKTAGELKEQFKTLGFTGNDLKNKVNQALGDERSARKIAAYAAIEFADREHGLLPDVAQIRKNSGTIKLVTGGKTNDSVASARAKELEEQNALLLAERLEAKQQMAQMQAQLAELLAAKGERTPRK